MKTAVPINKKLFDIFLLFSREPFVQYYTIEKEFYSNANGGLLGLISLDLTDNDYYGCILSRDESKQYRAVITEASIPTIEEARKWIEDKMSNNSITFHDNTYNFFDLFKDNKNVHQIHPSFIFLNDHIGLSAAKEVLKEISYHYKDIDGNFIEQFQSLNGFDSRVWELFLFCFFREQYFSFKRNHNSPDYLIQKFNDEIAVEAVIVGRKTKIDAFSNGSLSEIQEKLKNEIPLLFGSALFDKMKKKYWEQKHVRNKPFVIAIADFHDTMSMTWSSSALVEYLYGYRYEYSLDKKGKPITKSVKIPYYLKENGTKVPSGFFFLPESENISAIIFSSCGTLSKFNRMGKQAGLGNENVALVRKGTFHNHDPDATEPNIYQYLVSELSHETWSEGVIIFHNPNAKIPLKPEMFDKRVAQCFFKDETIYNLMPENFSYNSFTQILFNGKEAKAL